MNIIIYDINIIKALNHFMLGLVVQTLNWVKSKLKMFVKTHSNIGVGSS